LQKDDNKVNAAINQNYLPEFAVENYLHYQGQNFVERFDPNSYIYLTKAVDYFDLEFDYNNNLAAAFSNSQNVEFSIVNFSDDWLFPASENEKLIRQMIVAGIKINALTLKSNKGHDSFLLEDENLKNIISNFIA